MPAVFQFKFVLPPLVLLLFLYWADSPLLGLLANRNDSLLDASETKLIIIGVLGLFGVGFIISSISYALVINPLIDWVVGNNQTELNLWENMGQAKEFTQKQITKRWDMLVANVNMIFGLLFVGVAITKYGGNVSCAWIAAFLTLFAACSGNALVAARKMRSISDSLPLKT